MVACPQSFGDLLNSHIHIHGIISEGVFTKSGHFVPITDIDHTKAVSLFKENVFNLLLSENKITPEIVQNMNSWEHSVEQAVP
jgi:hypothetical protein